MNDALETASILNEQVERLLAAGVDRQLLQASEQGIFPDALWASVTDLGLAAALVPEERGGAGLDWSDLAGVFEALGAYAAPVPLGETIIAAWAVAATGFDLPDGLAVPYAGMLQHDAATGTVTGVASNVAWGNVATHVVGLAGEADRRLLCLLPAAGAVRRAVSSIGRDPRADLRFDSVQPVFQATCAIDLESPLALLRSGQMAGAIARCLELAVEYGNTRVQFGRQIGKFQAIQHMMAELANEAAAARTAARLGLRRFGSSAAPSATAVAKIRCGIAAGKATAVAHAVHGAIGVTEEHILHYLTRRLWQWRDDAGTEHAWAERLGHAALAQGGQSLWKNVVELSE